MHEFRKLGLTDETIQVLKSKGYEKPTLIQEKTIPILIEGKFDVVGQAQTGTGKTACFALPIIESIKENSRGIQAIILTPTRELALQVTAEFNSLKGKRKLRILTVYGGASMQDQMYALKQGIEIVVGTPGRVMDMIKRKRLNLANISFAVLDEADEMLNMGFVEDIQMILKQTNQSKRMLLFSATMPKEILNIARTFMREYKLIQTNESHQTLNLTNQIYYDIRNHDRYEAIRRIIAINDDFYGIIFCRTKIEVDELARKLMVEKYPVEALHGDIPQNQREKILAHFRDKKTTILVATDVAARGIDVNDLTHVINFSLPQSPEIYVHRIGRTGRAGKMGTAITFVIPSEKGKLKFIERIIKKSIERKEIPSVKEVIDSKKAKILETINKIVQDGRDMQNDQIVTELLANNHPKKVISALIGYCFRGLNSASYKEIQKVAHVHIDKKSFGLRGRNRPGRRERESHHHSFGRSGHKRKEFGHRS